MLKAINTVVANNNKELRAIITGIQNEPVPNQEMVRRLSMLLASGFTLEVFTQQNKPPELNKVVSSAPLPAFVEEAEDDDPEREDKDHKKAREDAIGFFG